MKNTIITILAIALVIAAATGIVFYGQSRDKDAQIEAGAQSLAKLQDEKSALNKELNTLRERLGNQERSLAELRGENQRMQTENQRLQELKAQLMAANGKLEAVQGAMQSREAALRDLTKAREESARQVALLEHSLAELRDENQRMQTENQRLQELKAQLMAANGKLAAAQGAMQSREAALRDLTEAREESARQVVLLERSLEDRQEQMAQLESELDDLLNRTKTALADKSHRIEQLEADKGALTEQLANGERTIKELRASEKALNDSLKSVARSLGLLQARHQEIREEVGLIEDQIKLKENRLGSLSSELTEAEAEKELAEKRAAELQVTYEALVEELREEISNREAVISAYEEKLSVSFVDKILFKSGEATITPSGKAKLNKVGRVLSRASSGRIQISGHTDNVPISVQNRWKFPTNWELSADRAASVVRFFIDQNQIPGVRLEAVGHADYKPVADNSTAKGRAQNRRVEISILAH